jgi:protein farnesyltransferase/geranylgeranyltransferase type-1 subunit alpha
VVLTENDIAAEKARRKEMATLKKELYGGGGPGGGGSGSGSLTLDPEWDDVVPIPQNEPENALAAITYPTEYAEGMCFPFPVLMATQC